LKMADMDSTATHLTKATRRAAGRPRSKASEALPAYGLACGAFSFREGLAARELGTLDRALAIVGRTLRTPRAAMHNPDAVKDYMRLALGGETVERFGVLYLDSQNRAIAFEIVFNGTLTQASVYPREIIRAALGHSAAAVILAHNHPSGYLKPSRADEQLTQTLKAALALLDVRVLDHVIVSGDQALSMAERGLV
jgi:DNA repair protein RadC